MANTLLNDREWFSAKKAKLTAKLSSAKTTKAFEQILKEIDKLNVEIRKLTKDIGDNKFWK